MYKYSLDRSSKKFICPRCQKKTFVRYVDNTTNEYIELPFGRCDRESRCKFYNSPSKNNIIGDYFEPKTRKEKSTINSSEVSKYGRNFKQNNFIQFLKLYFSDEEIKLAIQNYLIGTSDYWEGATIFWQINDQNQTLTGKVMLFDKESGKRIKKPYHHINWMHKILKLEDFVLQQCLFGLHLINQYENEIIALVESEKTAVIMSLFMPKYIWLATGSKGNFKQELLEPIKKFKILAFPDKSEYEDWNKKTKKLNLEGFNILCCDLIEKKNSADGTDLADIYIESKLQKNTIKKEIEYTKTQIEVNRLAKINPEILNLIKTFDLLDNHHNEIIQ